MATISDPQYRGTYVFVDSELFDRVVIDAIGVTVYSKSGVERNYSAGDISLIISSATESYSDVVTQILTIPLDGMTYYLRIGLTNPIPSGDDPFLDPPQSAQVQLHLYSSISSPSPCTTISSGHPTINDEGECHDGQVEDDESLEPIVPRPVKRCQSEVGNNLCSLMLAISLFLIIVGALFFTL